MSDFDPIDPAIDAKLREIDRKVMEANRPGARRTRPEAPPKQSKATPPPKSPPKPTKKSKVGRPPVRPSPFDEGMLDRVCKGLICGGSIVKVCKPKTMPSYNAVYLAMAKDEAFANSISRARAAQQDFAMDSTVALAMKATPETVRVVELQIRTMQWQAARLAPRRYGDKLSQEITGKDGTPLMPGHDVTDDDRMKALALLIKRTEAKAKWALPSDLDLSDATRTLENGGKRLM